MVSALVHGLLVAQHAAAEPALAAAFLTATGALVVAAALLHSGTATAPAAAGTALLLVGLVVAYVVDRTVGLPLSAAHGAAHADRVDMLGLATKAIELLGAAAALSLLVSVRRSVRSDRRVIVASPLRLSRNDRGRGAREPAAAQARAARAVKGSRQAAARLWVQPGVPEREADVTGTVEAVHGGRWTSAVRERQASP